MSFVLSETKIKQLCGDIAFKKGKSYHLAGKVNIQNYRENESIVEASVKGGSIFHVRVKHDMDGEVLAECNCPPLVSIQTYCQHVAAVLLYIQELERQESKKESQLAKQVLGLFNSEKKRPSESQTLFDTRKILTVKFICKPIYTKSEGYLIGVQLKAGLQELYNISSLKEFLEKVDSGEVYNSFTGFSYNPLIHSFQQTTNIVLKELREIVEDNHSVEKDTVIISPYNWKYLMPALLACPFVNVEQAGVTYKGLQVSNETLPLDFKLEETKSGHFQLGVKGLQHILILNAYGYVLYKGEMIKLSAKDCKRLADLSDMLNQSGTHQLLIPVEQLNQFMDTVIPGLMKLGHVQIAEEISERFVKTPLRVKLFLDRVKNRLLAGLEFQYGNLVINPFEEMDKQFLYNPTLKRESEKEQLIMKIMNDSLFTQTEGGFYMHDEEAEYHFLRHVVPTFEKWVEIYATSAVKLRIHKGYMGPKIKVNMDERTNWLAFTFDMQGIPESEIKKILVALEEKRKFYKWRNGTLLSLETKEFQNLLQFIQESNISIEDINRGETQLPLISGLQWIDTLQEGNIVTKGKAIQKLVENLKNPHNLDFVIPDSISHVLRDYQKVGFRWFKMLAQYKFGGILADDMGLGKTLQSIAYIVSVLPEIRDRTKPILIVSPSSLVYNWMNELKKFAPEIQACIIDGSKEKRSSNLKDLSDFDVIITSYPSLRVDATLYMKHSFHTLFLDEAQTFKNPATLTAKAVKKIKANHHFALTGTPIENSLDELWSIFHVVFPKLLPGRKDFSELTRAQVAKRVRPFILRRLKKDVLKELPEKIEIIQSSDLNLEQKKLYAAYLAELKEDTLKHLKKGDFQKNRIKILAGLTRLRQLCCHPVLFVEGYKGRSAKFDQLMNIIEECRIAGRRVLIFSQFTMMLDIIGRNLGYHGIPYFYLDGQTPPSERVDLCNRFNDGEGNLFLISLKAGGTGLNLTGADTVILYDLWWNPAVEQQAADRAYRMGQKNDVQVIKLVARGTIEEKMNDLQEKKKNLIGEVLQDGEESLSSITEQDIREILLID